MPEHSQSAPEGGPLGQPLTLPSGLTLPNRIAKAAMTENLADADNQPTERHERLYRRWADGGSGLLVTGNLMVDRRHLERSRNIVADSLLDVDALRHVVKAADGVPMLAQLNHPGRQCNRFLTSRPVAPSPGPGVSLLGLFARPRPLSADEVDDLVTRFGDSARRCEAAGMDGVQVHAAHGYLLAQFLSPHTNTRTDAWGGDVPRRARALLQVVAACRASTGDRFTVAVKLNSSDFRHGGLTEDDAEEVVRLLAEEGVDLLEVSGGTYESPALFGLAAGQAEGQAKGQADGRAEQHAARVGAANNKEAYFATFAARAKQAAPQVPIMLTGGLRTRRTMEALLESGSVDVIGLARPLAYDPDLPRKLLAGADGVELPAYTLPKLLALAGESEWYETQIGRLGEGRPVDLELSPLRASSAFVAGEMVRGLVGRARRARLFADAA